ncbi:MAG: hypothetical protein J5592_00885 [Clostridia bacterium]|nr:hypothetical protein [Clostridia bacterium]
MVTVEAVPEPGISEDSGVEVPGSEITDSVPDDVSSGIPSRQDNAEDITIARIRNNNEDLNIKECRNFGFAMFFVLLSSLYNEAFKVMTAISDDRNLRDNCSYISLISI